MSNRLAVLGGLNEGIGQNGKFNQLVLHPFIFNYKDTIFSWMINTYHGCLIMNGLMDGLMTLKDTISVGRCWNFLSPKS